MIMNNHEIDKLERDVLNDFTPMAHKCRALIMALRVCKLDLINARKSDTARGIRLAEQQGAADNWDTIREWITDQPDCPFDASCRLVTPADGRLWIEVLSDNLANETFDPSENTCDPIWDTFGITSTLETIRLNGIANNYTKIETTLNETNRKNEGLRKANRELAKDVIKAERKTKAAEEALMDYKDSMKLSFKNDMYTLEADNRTLRKTNGERGEEITRLEELISDSCDALLTGSGWKKRTEAENEVNRKQVVIDELQAKVSELEADITGLEKDLDQTSW